MINKKTLKLGLVIFLIGLIGLVFFFDLQQFLTLNYLKSQQQILVDYYHSNTVFTIVIYFVVYVVATALSIPGAAVLTLFGGALFGLLTGTIIISFASTLGATLAFLTSRFLLRDYVQTKF
ncbi:MAG: hypothetical protein HOE30_12800, partial [Deltaproteobacteria bacterium]|nr:hypothetical protein [Deltaproteobacteria bacterium]